MITTDLISTLVKMNRAFLIKAIATAYAITTKKSYLETNI